MVRLVLVYAGVFLYCRSFLVGKYRPRNEGEIMNAYAPLDGPPNGVERI